MKGSKRLLSLLIILILMMSVFPAAVFAAEHEYDHQYDPICNICGEKRTVDLTRPMVDMFRMYDPNSGEHFYTGSEVERENLIAEGWQYEGIGFTFPLNTGAPVYRLYDPVYGEHLYTMDEIEKNSLLAQGWNYEGIAFNSGFDIEVPQYRLHNPNEKRGAYHFTASTEERDFLLSVGWEYQGIGWYSCGVVEEGPVLELDNSVVSLKVGASATLSYTYTGNKTLSWGSRNPAIVTVSDGRITAKAVGTANVYVTDGDMMDVCTVTVTAPPSPSGHSEFYIEDLSVEDVITYFAEVCLDTEYGDKIGGSLIRKWVSPVAYKVHGQPTARDMEVLNAFIDKLNSISNFPGMYPVESGADLNIYFYGQQDFVDLMGSDFIGDWGGVTFWYDGLSQIYTETIGIRTDIPQNARDSIIAEELYNGLGPVQDTYLRTDSLIYQWSNENCEMTAIDELILKLLYHPSIRTGMNYNQCETAIKRLYY